MTEDFPGCPVAKTLPSNAGGVSSIPGWGSKIPHVMQGSQKKKITKVWDSKYTGGKELEYFSL